jgi:mono/diheme cytochrome c family protein
MRCNWFAVTFLLAGAVLAVSAPGAADLGKPTGAPALDFERDIQPILVRCVQCHGPGQARGGLRLDQRAAATAVADSGSKAIVPGQPDQSELLKRILATANGQRMPPKGDRLGAGEVEKLRRWIADGAAWPEHWAYRPLTRTAPPAAGTAWAKNPIDAYILAQLARRGLTPAPPAERATLLRRIYFDLIGLPPTPLEIEAARSDPSAEWFENVVERLLASPHYGERWARHWMDVVHYAETHGHDQDSPREHAWPYRDYLIRSFNEDRPYGRFVQEQVAGDVLFPQDPWALAATGFLAAGPWDESSLKDIREDSLDREIGRYLDRDDIVTNVMSTFVSTTVHCARCHDHKFDPVTQREYYALQAVFSGIDKANRPYDSDPVIALRRRQLEERRATLAKQRAAADPALLDPALQGEVAAWEKAGAASLRAWQVLEAAEFKSASGSTLVRQPDGSVRSEGERPETDTYTVVAHSAEKNITGILLEVLTDDALPRHGPGRQDNGNFHLNEFVLTAAPRGQPTAAKPVVWKQARADFEQQDWTIAHAVDQKPETAWGIYPQVGKPHRAVFVLKEPLAHTGGVTLTFRLEQTHGRQHLIGRFRLSITSVPQPGLIASPTEIDSILKVAPAQRTDRQRAELAGFYLGQRLEREAAALPPLQLVYCGTNAFTAIGSFKPTKAPRPVHLLKRGDVKTPGTAAEPGALACVPGLDPRFQLASSEDEGARRAALARWLSDPRNGLTWRSMANRLWQHHFGRGLVDTPNDFGRMGSPPTHPELLDWLAATLRDNGGSLKQLHRLIVTSAAYRQSSRHQPAFAEIDADNRSLWRQNRRRLDAEALRDAVLRISGKLDPTMGGPSVKQFIQTPGIHVTPNVDYLKFDVDHASQYRRSVYRFLFRTLPDPFMEALDCPDGSQAMPVRGASVTALQALAMLNDKFMVRQAEHIAARIAREAGGPDQQVEVMYRLVLGRSPAAAEAAAVDLYLKKHGLANACRVLLNSNEFVFVE